MWLSCATACGSPSAGAGASSADSGPVVDSGPVDGGAQADASPAPGADGGRAGDGGDADADTTGAESPWVMGYYASWHDPANGGSYGVSSIDWDALTHVAAAFYVPDGKGGWASGYFDASTAASLIAAGHAHGKKVLASIGGSGSGPAFETSMQSAMAAFLASLDALLATGYDGLDIDWEGGNLPAAQDFALQKTLVDGLRAHSPSALITLTAGYENENQLDDLSFYGQVAGEVDRINLMTYGMAGAWPGWQSWHSSPLHWNQSGSTPTGIDSSVGHYIAADVPAAKLGIGIGLYGMCYTAPVSGPGQALGGSQVIASDGTMSYPNIMSSLYSAAAYHYDSSAEVPYLTLTGSNAQKCTYVSYEDPTSIAAKGSWAKSRGLGGVILWEIGEGYVPSGATVPDQNPLLEATKTAFLQ
jgi:chitinase